MVVSVNKSNTPQATFTLLMSLLSRGREQKVKAMSFLFNHIVSDEYGMKLPFTWSPVIHITLMSCKTGLTKSRKLNMQTGTVDNIRKFFGKFPYFYVWQSKWYLLWMVGLSPLLACWVIRRCSVNFLFRRGYYLGWTTEHARVWVCVVRYQNVRGERIEISNIIRSCCGHIRWHWRHCYYSLWSM